MISLDSGIGFNWDVYAICEKQKSWPPAHLYSLISTFIVPSQDN